jgi:hypothetical protein
MEHGKIRIGLVTVPYLDMVNIICDRTSVLGNPIHLKDNTKKERDKCCDSFELYFFSKMRLPNSKIRKKVEEIIELLKNGVSVNLQCHCFPKRCHTETIKRFIEEKLKDSK